MEDEVTEPTVTREMIRRVLFGEDDQARREFSRRFESGIENFVILMEKTYQGIQGMERRVPNELRSAWTYNFLFIAFNNLLTSFHLQIAGMITPAGNLMRQYGECIALALLCSSDDLPDFANLMRLEEEFPVHKCLGRFSSPKVQEAVGLDPEDWVEFEEFIQFYHKLSHPTFIAAGATVVFSKREGRVIGGAFDEEKMRFYDGEIRHALSAAMRLRRTTDLCVTNLNGGAGPDDSACIDT